MRVPRCGWPTIWRQRHAADADQAVAGVEMEQQLRTVRQGALTADRTGVGNADANMITGNSGNNVLDGALVAQPFDTESLTISGESIPLGFAVSGASTFYSAFSVSESGVPVEAPVVLQRPLV